MKMFLSRIHFPVTTLGYGRRVGVWFQGCSIQCPGCLSRDTWAPRQGETTIDAVCEAIDSFLGDADGITISGGEPFDQPDALAMLLRWLRARVGQDADVLVYSGYPIEKLAPYLGEWNGLIDLLISDPYDPSAGQTLALRGSDNQRVHCLTPLGQQRYGTLSTQPRDATTPALDVVVDGETAWMAGIPAPGDLQRLAELLAAAGFSARTTQQPSVLA